MRGGQLAGILRLIPIRGCGLLTMLQVPGVPFPLTLIPSPLPKGSGRMLTTLRIDSGLMSNQTRHVIPLRTAKNQNFSIRRKSAVRFWLAGSCMTARARRAGHYRQLQQINLRLFLRDGFGERCVCGAISGFEQERDARLGRFVHQRPVHGGEFQAARLGEV